MMMIIGEAIESTSLFTAAFVLHSYKCRQHQHPSCQCLLQRHHLSSLIVVFQGRYPNLDITVILRECPIVIEREEDHPDAVTNVEFLSFLQFLLPFVEI